MVKSVMFKSGLKQARDTGNRRETRGPNGIVFESRLDSKCLCMNYSNPVCALVTLLLSTFCGLSHYQQINR